MPLPKKVKPTLPLVPNKTLSARREELLEYINKDGTYLPKSVLHEDLDRGMLDFVKEELQIIVEGAIVPTVDRIITTQNWSQYVETNMFVDLDYNPSPPFVTLVRNPEVKYGTNPSTQYTIPNRKQFYYASVPTWDGNVAGMDIYTIPQPVPVDIKYSLKIICNRMRELNQLNKVVLQKFSSRQAYSFIKGQYVPIILDNISDESQMSLDSRKYYIQTYDFTMLGYLIDEEEFEVKPAIARALQLVEVETAPRRRRRKVDYFGNADLPNMDLTTTPTPSVTPTMTPTNMVSPTVTPTNTSTPTPTSSNTIVVPDLSINYDSPPTAWSLNQCLDVIIEITNVGNGTTFGNIAFLVLSINSWTFNFNSSQTTSETILGNIVDVQNSDFTLEIISVGSFILGYNFTTNQILTPSQNIKLALQICAPGFATNVNLNSIIQPGSGGETFNDNNNVLITITSQ